LNRHFEKTVAAIR